MSHADTLRGMASDEHILAGRENPRSTALHAGADALDTLARVRDVLDQLDKYSDAAYLAYKTNPENTRLDGQAMAYEQAVVLIQRALGGTP